MRSHLAGTFVQDEGWPVLAGESRVGAAGGRAPTPTLGEPVPVLRREELLVPLPSPRSSLPRTPKAGAQLVALLWKRRRLRQDVEAVVAGYVSSLHPRENVPEGFSAHRRWSVFPTSRGSVAVTVSVQHISATSNESVARPDWEYGLLQELRALLEQHGHRVGEVLTDWRVTALDVRS